MSCSVVGWEPGKAAWHVPIAVEGAVPVDKAFAKGGGEWIVVDAPIAASINDERRARRLIFIFVGVWRNF